MSDSAERHGFHRPTAMCSRDLDDFQVEPDARPRRSFPSASVHPVDLSDELSNHHTQTDPHNKHRDGPGSRHSWMVNAKAAEVKPLLRCPMRGCEQTPDVLPPLLPDQRAHVRAVRAGRSLATPSAAGPGGR